MSSSAELSEQSREPSAVATPRPPSSGFPELAKYELLEEIGHGGMATVYRARDPRLGREVAVKVIHKHLRENAEVGARFIAEARAAAKLRHANIVEVFDVSTEDDRERYLVAELIRGATLRKVLLEHREMPAEVGAAITLELCEAVEHAHEASIVHRDIKPENVLVELPSDRAALPERESPSARKKASADAGVIIKLTDFGIAKLLDVQGVTSTGQVLGSPAHMAPEQIEGGDVDARTDVFGLGVLMYECLVGHLPFEGKNPAQVLRKVLEGTYPSVDRERPTTGGRWSQIVDARAREGRRRSHELARRAGRADQGRAARARDRRSSRRDQRVLQRPDGVRRQTQEAHGGRARGAGRGGEEARGRDGRRRGLQPRGGPLSGRRGLDAQGGDAARERRPRAKAAARGAAGGPHAGPRPARVRSGARLARLARRRRRDERRGRPRGDRRQRTSRPSPCPTSSSSPRRPGPIPARRRPWTTNARASCCPRASATGPPPKMRAVQFVITPPGATLLLDGQEVKWFGKTLQLPGGPPQRLRGDARLALLQGRHAQRRRGRARGGQSRTTCSPCWCASS
jgi:serine/threonine protein kinase